MSTELAPEPDGRLGAIFYPIVRRSFDEDGDLLGQLEDELAAARMAQTAEMYLAKAVGVGFFVGLALWGLGVGLGYTLTMLNIVGNGPLTSITISAEWLHSIINQARIPALIGLFGLVFGSIGFIAGFGGILAIPYMKSNTREREINILLPDAIAFMYALSVGGLNQIEILETMAKSEDTYGEVATEFQVIVTETTFFDTDYRSAIRNQAFKTPSEELSQFLTDMLSILNSGGDFARFLEDKKDKHMRTAKQEQELTLDTLELFGEMYMTLSLFPLLLIIILVIMSMLGEASQMMLYLTVYALIPLIGVGFLVMISTVKQDELGNGYLTGKGETGTAEGEQPRAPADHLAGSGVDYQLFTRITRQERRIQMRKFLRRPHRFFRDHPTYTLLVTVPIALIALAFAVLSGMAPLGLDGFVADPVGATVLWVYMPVYVSMVPLAIFYEWNVRARYGILNNLSDTLRKLSSANDTGQTVLESIESVAQTSKGKLATEFATIRAKVEYGTTLGDALIEFNNRYHIPRLARTVKLIQKAQEASSEITDVLSTAAQASENQDDIRRERRSRTLMQVAIIIMTYLTLLAVMAILKVQFLEVLGEMTGSGGGGAGGAGGISFSTGVDVNLLSVMFFHAVTMQAILSGLISGYMRDANLLSGVKFVLILITIALAVWSVVG